MDIHLNCLMQATLNNTHNMSYVITMERVPSKGRLPSLIRVFTVRTHEETLGPHLPIECTAKTDQTGCTYHFVGFVMRRLNYVINAKYIG